MAVTDCRLFHGHAASAPRVSFNLQGRADGRSGCMVADVDNVEHAAVSVRSFLVSIDRSDSSSSSRRRLRWLHHESPRIPEHCTASGHAAGAAICLHTAARIIYRQTCQRLLCHLFNICNRKFYKYRITVRSRKPTNVADYFYVGLQRNKHETALTPYTII